MNESVRGAALAAKREVSFKHCVHCGEIIEGIKIKKYCNESCKQAAKYLRSKTIKK